MSSRVDYTSRLGPSLPVIVIGNGGHGRVVLSALKALGSDIICVTDLEPGRLTGCNDGIVRMLDEEVLRKFHPDQVELVLGIGAVGPCDDFSPRVKAVKKFLDCGFRFIGFIHPAAWVASEAHLDPTVQVHAGTIVQPGAVVGAHTILNTGCSVDHDCQISNFCHVAPGAILSGEVKVGCGSHLGTGCVVIQSIEIGKQCLIAAGATVVKSVENGQYVRGTPAKPFTLRQT